MLKRIIGFCLLFATINAYAGNLFQISYSGTSLPKSVSITLCLTINGNTPLSCQNYLATQSNLSITTTVLNHTYLNAGIRVNTPGYQYSPTYKGHLGYSYLGSVSDQQAATGVLLTASSYQSVLNLPAKGYNTKAALLLVNGVFYGTTTVGGVNNVGTIFSVNPDGSHYNTLYSFGANVNDGYGPAASLINVNGVLCGTTTQGGVNGAGTVFSINADGSQYHSVYSFGATATDGASPQSALLNVNGVLYGTTTNGGLNNNSGTVFSINSDGSNYLSLYSFGASGTDGTKPVAALINVNGVLYGTTTAGGTHTQGTVFSINSDGTNYNVLYSFGLNANDGRVPRVALLDVGGILFGTTTNGGTYHVGTIYSIHVDGSNYNTLYSFGSSLTDGKSPEAALLNVNGVLYGTTILGGVFTHGTVFNINPNGSSYATLYSFAANNDGQNSYEALINVSGVLYGTTLSGGVNSNTGTLFSINPDGSNYNIFYNFGSNNIGTNPIASLLNVNSVLYGTTTYGGANDKGAVFSVNGDGSNYKTIYSFGASSNDGTLPLAALIYSNGVFYGTTGFGGSNSNSGTLYSINPDGTNYNSFYSLGANGTTPSTALLDVAGVLYGTTSRAGTNNGGTFFSINPDGSNYNTLYAFGAHASDGLSPLGTLLNIDGVLFGTTSNGGANSKGTVYSIDLDGSHYSVLYSFGANMTDGANPQAGLININGILYGTTSNGGVKNDGTVFSINPDGSHYSVLYSFGVNITDGENPFAALLNVNGVLYGTTTSGGMNSTTGTIFSLNLNGSNYTTLHSFAASGDGTNPYAALIEVNGVLYGTTQYGGVNAKSAGTVFKLG